MIYNVLVVFYNNKYIFDFSDFLLPQTPGATYMIHMTNSLNYCNFFLFILFMTKSLLFYDQIIFFLMWCILRLSRVKDIKMWLCANRLCINESKTEALLISKKETVATSI